jgi:hypothetical protein
VDVSFEVEAEEQPPPPADVMVVVSGERERRERRAESGVVILRRSSRGKSTRRVYLFSTVLLDEMFCLLFVLFCRRFWLMV